MVLPSLHIYSPVASISACFPFIIIILSAISPYNYVCNVHSTTNFFFSCILCVWWFDCLYVCESLPCLIPVEVRREDSSLWNWSDRRLRVNMWMLVTKPYFSGRPASALSHQAISPGLTSNFHIPEKIRGKEEAGSFRVCILLCRNLNHL